MTGTVTENIVSHLSTIVGDVFTSLGQLIASPLGQIMVLAIAIFWLYKIRKMSQG